MTAYLAGRWSNRDRLREMADTLRKTGTHVNSRWLESHDRAVDGDGPAIASIDNLQDIRQADVVIVLSPSGRHGGSHVEFGFALGIGRPLILIGDRQNVFHHDPSIFVIADDAGLYFHLGRAMASIEQGLRK